MEPHERLEAWRACHALVIAIYRITAGWPWSERFGLTQQIRRAAVSAASNIVEGQVRAGPKAFRYFLSMAVGSLAELGYLVRLAGELGFLTPQAATQLIQLHGAAARLTGRLYTAVAARAR